MKKETKLWTMQNGTKIRICDMSDSHLKNTMEMLERLARRSYQDELADAYSFLGSCRGDMASYAAEQAADEVGHKDWGDYIKDIYWNMVEETKRRDVIE